MFPDRQWNVDGVKSLIKKTDMTGSIDRWRGSGRPHGVRTPANINEVDVKWILSTKFEVYPTCNMLRYIATLTTDLLTSNGCLKFFVTRSHPPPTLSILMPGFRNLG